MPASRSAAEVSWYPFPGLAALPLVDRLVAARKAVSGRLVFTTSFGLEAQALTHAVAEAGIEVEFVTLDTGRLFPETYDLWAETECRYGLRIAAVSPDRDSLEALVDTQGINGFRESIEARKLCCAVRKVDPLRRALAGAGGWLTGMRADQSSTRSALDFVTWDAQHRLVKINPLLDWTRERVRAFVRDNDVPYNPLHDVGFLSIGCAPCTRAVGPGEPERAGRWWWEADDKKECGLHPPQVGSAPDAAVAQDA